VRQTGLAGTVALGLTHEPAGAAAQAWQQSFVACPASSRSTLYCSNVKWTFPLPWNLQTPKASYNVESCLLQRLKIMMGLHLFETQIIKFKNISFVLSSFIRALDYRIIINLIGYIF
jgi:hypothetical protein